MLNKSRFYPIILIIVAGLLVYINSLNNPFIWDDQVLVVDNYFIKDLRYIFEIFKANLSFASGTPSCFYRPMQNLTYLLDYRLFGNNPWGFRITNIFLHISNAILVYFIILRFASSLLIPGQEGRGAGSIKTNELAFFVSLLFVVHPIHSEAVTYISGRADPLMGLFLLSGLLAYIKYRTSKKRRFYFGSVVLFVLGLLSKELAIVFPMAILLYEFCLSMTEKRGFRFYPPSYKSTGLPAKPHLLNITPFLIISLTYAILRLWLPNFVKSYFIDSGFPRSVYPLSARFLVFLTNIPIYLRLLVIPTGLHMSRNVVLFRWSNFLHPMVLFSVLFFVFIIIGTFLTFKKRNYLIVFWVIWFFIFLLPQSGLFPINAFIAEHFIYSSSIGFFLIFIYFLIKYLPKRIWISLLIPSLIFYGYITIRRNSEWKDPLIFYESLVKRSPYSFTGYNNLGVVYANQGLLDEAQDAFEQAIRIEPKFLQAYINRAKILYKKDKVRAAISQCLEITERNPRLLYGHTVLASIYVYEKMYDKAIGEFKLAVELSPKEPGIYNSLGLVYREVKHYESAIQQFKKAIALDKKNENFYNNLGVVYKDKGQYQLAIKAYLEAVKINKNLAEVYNNLGIVYARMQNYPQAESVFGQAIRLKPDYPDAYFNLGSLYWQMNRIDLARDSWQKVLVLEPEHKLAGEWLRRLEKVK